MNLKKKFIASIKGKDINGIQSKVIEKDDERY